MKIEEIIDVIKKLSRGQGFYSRLYNQLMEMDKDDFENVKQEFEKKNFKDAVALVLFLEGGE